MAYLPWEAASDMHDIIHEEARARWQGCEPKLIKVSGSIQCQQVQSRPAMLKAVQMELLQLGISPSPLDGAVMSMPQGLDTSLLALSIPHHPHKAALLFLLTSSTGVAGQLLKSPPSLMQRQLD